MAHLLLNAVIRVFVESFDDRLALVLGLLHDSYLGRSLVHMRLESVIAMLLLLTLHSKLLKFFVLGFLKFSNTLVDWVTALEFFEGTHSK